MAKKDELSQKLKALAPGDAFGAGDPRAATAFSVQVPVEKLRDAVSACDAAEFFLESLAGLDFEDTLELVYHFNAYEPGSRIALRVLAPHGKAVPSICDIVPAAAWYERENHDYFGIVFEGNPDLRPLLLPEDADFNPLRKTFGKVVAYHKREVIYG